MKTVLALLLAFLQLDLDAQAPYWQQQVNYTIDVTLNDQDHTLDGFEKISYINNSPDTLRFIWFHLWPNAYKNDQTAFSEQLLLNGRTDFYFSDKDQRGYINRLDFKVDGATAVVEDHPRDIDIIRIMLPEPLTPGNSVAISTPFRTRLPANFSRSGHAGQAYLVAQWYPKPAVYDRFGWHPMPYLDQGEFYSDFGDYDVRITLPENYVVASTGVLQDKEELAWLKARANYEYKPTLANVKGKTKPKPESFPASSSKTKTIRYLQQQVIDFAWFADKRYRVNADTMQLPSGKWIDLFSFYLPSNQASWKNSTAIMKEAVRTRSAWLGEYPYNTVSVVEAPMGFAGGMEYPTITSITTPSSAGELEETLSHEVSHNWLYGILATNERDYPWMDEGMNTYYDVRENERDKASTKTTTKTKRLPEEPQWLVFETLASLHKDQPVNTPSEKLTAENYGLSAYYKAGTWMKKLEQTLGRETFDAAMQQYYNTWQFKHPYPQDFKNVIEAASGRKLDSLFNLLNRRGSLEPPVKKHTKLVGLGSLKNTTAINYVSVLPAIGGNMYDGFMIGPMVQNFQFPVNPFSFFVMPLFATSSKKLNGVARASYHWFAAKRIDRVDVGINAAAFSTNDYKPARGGKLFTGYKKLVPFIRLTLKEQDPLSTIERYIQLKSFVIREDQLRFQQQVIGPDTSTSVTLHAATRNLLQLQFAVSDSRVLYPYRASLVAEQQAGFVRLAFTGNYFFNYSNGVSGMNLRLFAGKFLYTGNRSPAKQFATDRYHLNLSGPNGYEDYTYSNYFVGRNEFEGLASQQLMMRDGGFKVNTALLSNKVGKTDDWLLSTNLVTDIPKSINPLEVLPVKIPLKIFLDVGTNAAGWQKNAADSRFLFDAGFQLSLFKETLNIYVPVVYSKVFRDYIRSTLGDKRFLKTISFSIDIQQIGFKKIGGNIPFHAIL